MGHSIPKLLFADAFGRSGDPTNEGNGVGRAGKRSAEAAAPNRARSLLAAGVLLVVVAVLVATGLVAAGPLLRRTGLNSGQLPSADPSLVPVSTPSQSPSASVGAGQPQSAPSPASGLQADAQMLADRLNGVRRNFTGGKVSVVVAAPGQSRPLYAMSPDAMLVPASNTKVLTVISALSALGAQASLTTRVTMPTPGHLVLVGGGDPYLRTVPDASQPAFATLQRLAEQTAAALRAKGTTQVSLDFDDSLFAGPDWAPTWQAGYRDQVTPIHGLMVDGGRKVANNGALSGERSQQPAIDATAAFAGRLRALGITVNGTPKQAAPPQSGAPDVASVESAPLIDLAERTLVTSDNTAAEMLGRQLALARKQPATFAGAVGAIEAELRSLRVWTNGAHLDDGSGLSRSNHVSASMLVGTWQAAYARPELRPAMTSLPVAGVSGTLRDRYYEEGAGPGRGAIHAKSGTLTGVTSLSGWTLTQSGQIAIFAVIVNEPNDDWPAREWVDQVTAAISGCGCTRR